MSKIKFSVFILVIIFMMSSVIKVHAEENDENNKYKGIIQVNYGYIFDDGSMDVFVSAPGVVVNSDTVITYDLTKGDFKAEIESRKKGYETLGIEIDKLEEKFSFALYNGEGRYIPVASDPVKRKTNAGDILLLQTEESLSNNALVFSPLSELNDKEWYALGFPKDDMDGSHFVGRDSILKQSVNIINEEDDVIEFSIDSNEFFQGGAIINGYGELYGIILETENDRVALSVSEIKNILEELRLFVKVADVIVPIDMTEFNSVTDAAAKVNTTEIKYTEESLATLQEKIDAAQNIKLKEDASQEEIDKAAEELLAAMNNLEEDTSVNYSLIIFLVVGVIILIAVIVLVILCIRDKNLIFKLLGVKKKGSDSSAVEAKNSDNFDEMRNYQGGYIYEHRRDTPNNINNDVVPDTSVLRNDIESNDEITGIPYIIRVTTGERILINNKKFSIGRDLDVDYRVPDNISISKCHCYIINKEGQWYIRDNDSSNKTFLNGKAISPNIDVLLSDKMEIMLSSETFIYRCLDNENKNDPFVDVDEMSTSVLSADPIMENKKVPYLVIDNKIIKMTSFPFSLGRSKVASYKFTNDVEVSREHVIISNNGGNYYVRDNGSSNGTMLNNQQLKPETDYILNDGDKITILNDVIEFYS